MKKIFKFTKNKKSIISALLAAVSIFTFNFSPISIISNKIAMAAKYEATETKVTENTSANQIVSSDVVSNLKDYFTKSNSELNLSEYYETLFEDLYFDKVERYLKTINGFSLGSNESLEKWFANTNQNSYLEFINSVVSDLDKYSSHTDKNTRLTYFYNDLTAYLKSETSNAPTVEEVDDFYKSDVYKQFKELIDAEIKKSIAIVAYDGKDDNKVAAIIADNAPSTTNKYYGSNYEQSETRYLDLTSSNVQFNQAQPFNYQEQSTPNTYKQFNISKPYEVNSKTEALVVYALNDGDESRQATYDFLGYKSISLEEVNSNDYYAVPYSTSNIYYFRYLYNQLVSNNQITQSSISETDFVNLFYTDEIDGVDGKQSILYVKYSNETLINQLYIAPSQKALLDSNFNTYKYYYHVIPIEPNEDMNDYVKVSATSLSGTYKLSELADGDNDSNNDIVLYFKKTVHYYTDNSITYLTDKNGDYIFEKELTLDYDKIFELNQTTNKKQIYILDESENASENKIYQSLGYTVITSPTKEYYLIDKTDDNYNEKYSLYYKYADIDTVFTKNKLTKTNGTEKDAVYVLTSSVTTDITTLCKANNYIQLTKDDLAAGFYTKLNAGDALYTKEYELYYRFDTSLVDGNYHNAKYENKIYEYTSSSSSDYIGFYKTDKDYNIEHFVKIEKSDADFKQGHDLYYKKTFETKDSTVKENSIDKNTVYYFATKNEITFTKNSYYAISFYANTTAGLTGSLEFEDSSEILNDAKISFSTDGKWIKYYLFIATDALTDSKAKIIMSMGSKDGISTGNENVSGSVLFDDVIVYKINESDFLKKTINNKNVYELTESDKKVDSIELNNAIDYENSYSARIFNNNIVDGWDEIFNFDSNSFNLSNLDKNLNNVDGYNFNQYFESDNSLLWHYFIGRDVSGKNHSELLADYRKAYADLQANISIENEADKKAPEAADDDENISTQAEEDDDDKKVEINDLIENTFNENNKILKIENTSASKSLGIVSKPFTLNRSECYKISLYVYSAEKDSTATIKVISNLLTAQSNEFGIELSAGASDISAYLESDDDKTENEYRWIPVEFYIQGNVLADQECNLVLMADENSTVYFDNIKIEKITTAKYTDTSAGTRVYKLALTSSSNVITKTITNGYFNDVEISELDANNNAPMKAKNWTISSDAAQDYVTAGVISGKNTDFSNGNTLNNALATNMYVIDINGTEDIKTASHKIYTSSTASLSANSLYKLTFEYYYVSNAGQNEFIGDIVANLYQSAYKPENKISSIRTTIDENSTTANGWNTVTFYIATGTTSLSSMLELGVEDAKGTLFIRKVGAKTISKSLDQIRVDIENLTQNKDHNKIVDLSSFSFTINKDKDDDGIIASNEFNTNSKNNEIATTGKTGVVIANYFTNHTTTEKTVKIDDTTYYLYEDENDELGVYQYSIYSNTNLSENKKLDKISQKSFEIVNNKIVIGSGINKKEYDIVENTINNLTYNFENDATINNTTISAEELNNQNSNNVLILANANETDYTEIESKFKMSLSASSYYALKFYVKTSDFEKDNIGLSISVKATNLDINWSEHLINTNDVTATLHKDSFGFVCYQLVIETNKTSYNDVIVKFSLGDELNTGKGYAIISKVELTKLANKDEFDHYSEIFVDEEDKSIVKTASGSTTTEDTTNKSTNENEMTWATFFYIFSSLLLVVTLVIAMVAIVIRKHPRKAKVKISSNENFNIDNSKKESKIDNDVQQDSKEEDGGIE